MVRPKGLGMPARRKRKVPEPQEECEVMDNSEDEDRLYGSASPSSSSTSSEPATRGPNKEKADAAYQEAAEELDAMRVIMAKENSKLKLAKRLYEAKMRRFEVSVDKGEASPLGQLERYYEARQEYTKARLRHSTVKLMMTEMEARVNKALVAVRDAEIARLRLHAA